MPTVRELVTRFGFDIDDKALSEFDKGIAASKIGLLGLGAAVAGAGVAIFGLIKTAANHADELYKTSKAAGVTVESLQKLGYAASLSGASTEELGTGLRFLSRNIFEATTNRASEAAFAFRKMGISIFDAHGKARNAADVALDLADRFKGMKNPTEKAALSMQLLGRSGGGLVEFFDKGSVEIKKLTGELDEFGGVMSDQTVHGLIEFNDSLTRLFYFFGVIRNELAAGLAPVFTRMIDETRRFLIVNKEVIKTNLTGFVKGLSGFLQTAWKFTSFLAQALASVVKVLGGAEFATKSFLYFVAFLSSTSVVFGIMATVNAFLALATALDLTAGGLLLVIGEALLVPALIVAAVSAILLLFEDIYGYFTGKDSVTEIIVNAFSSAWRFIKTEFLEFWSWMKTKLADLGNVLSFGAFGFSGASGKPGTGITPFTAPIGGAISNQSSNASVQVNSPITVSVPPGTDPSVVGDRVQSGVGDAFEQILRNAGRNASPALGW